MAPGEEQQHGQEDDPSRSQREGQANAVLEQVGDHHEGYNADDEDGHLTTEGPEAVAGFVRADHAEEGEERGKALEALLDQHE